MQPTPVLLPGESQGRWSLVGCHLWGRTESDTTEATQQQQQQQQCLLDLIDYLPFHVEEIFNYNLFKNFLILFLFLFFFWDPYYSNVVAFDIVPEVSKTILSSFHSLYFIVLFRSYFHHSIFQLTDSFFCFRYSAIDFF